MIIVKIVNGEFDFIKLAKSKVTGRYEKRLDYLKNKPYETHSIEKAVKESIDNIKSGERSFIIYGDPQSGKTEMMIALTAKLLDEGNKIIIVLITDNISLLNQNLERFVESGINPSPKSFSEIMDNNVIIGDSNWIIFCKKNAADLRKLNKKLNGIDGKVIIDDEADFATPNSKVNSEERSTINSLTDTLLGNGIYIGVTATPARLDLNNTHNNKNSKWIYFEPHSNYVGQDTFFPVEPKTLDFKLNFLPDDNPKHIITTLFNFLVDVAYLNIGVNKEKEQNYSFLIHTTGRIEGHASDRELLEKTFSILVNESIDKKEREEYYKNVWLTAKNKYPGYEDKITSYITENIQRYSIVVLNSTYDYPSVTNPPALFTIVMGGNIISRGVTFNNLLSMLFTRTVKSKFHQDTYIQRARMFGNRKNYLKYFELSIPEDLYFDWCDCFILHRLSLKSIISGNGAPVWVYGNRNKVTSGSSIDRSTVRSSAGELGFALFDFDKSVIDKILNESDTTNHEKLIKLSKIIGKESLPEFLLQYMGINASHGKETIKIHNSITIETWGKETDKENLSRDRGFIATSSADFNEYGHHVQIIYNNKNKARLIYKPSSSKLGFLQNTKWVGKDS